MHKFPIFFFALVINLSGFWACTKATQKLQYYPAKESLSGLKPTEHKTGRLSSTSTWEDHLPDPERPELMPLRTLRVNFHIVNSADSSKSFKPQAGRDYIHALLRHANADLDTNVRNWRSPEGTAVLPRMYRYELTPQPTPGDDGIYFHYDDTFYYYVVSGRNQNNYDRKVIDRYGIGLDTIVNVFIQVHHPDSIRSKYYKASGQAIALGTDVKLSGLYELKEPPQNFRGMFNHEIGHVLGLGHAWHEDGCPDTEHHQNRCYAWTPEPPCDALATNNMMDYNAYEIAVTPCQIGKMHKSMSEERNPAREIVKKTYCTKNLKPVVVNDSLTWKGARDLESDIIIMNGGVLTLQSRLSMPAGSSITVEPGGTLILDGARLHNACNLNWDGIFTQKKGKSEGKVVVLKPFSLENTAKQ